MVSCKPRFSPEQIWMANFMSQQQQQNSKLMRINYKDVTCTHSNSITDNIFN